METAIRIDHAKDPIAAAIEVFKRQGYESTTVDDLADAVELSRSTFFRRYGSKEDVVFADHELLLRRVEALLQSSPLAPLQTVCAGARLVFDHHVERRDVSVARYSLLHDVAALRDRELVTTHRYERAFARYLQKALPQGQPREYASIAFSAAVVAVHNAVLRSWLLEPDKEFGQVLDAQLGLLTHAMDTAPQMENKDRILVTVIEPGVDSESTVDAIRAFLNR